MHVGIRRPDWPVAKWATEGQTSSRTMPAPVMGPSRPTGAGIRQGRGRENAMTSNATEIVRLKVSLDHVRPTVMRRIEVPIGMKLDTLHGLIQASMPWDSTHPDESA